jgi:transcriptional regulator with PAS, ATPase and Fis domain
MRSDKNFVPINCGAIPPELVESELFGYAKGAFTGAAGSKPGYFEMAHKGTLFLDEVGELPKNIQVKLLRVLQEGEVYRVGSTKPIKIDVRVIAATNRSLIDEVVNDSFREDLFYRLAVAVIKLPPLRERPGDLSLLIDKLMDQINMEGEFVTGYKHKKISASARNLLINYNWPGNIRELYNTLTRAAIWSTGTSITDQDIQDAIISIPGAKSTDMDILNRPMEYGIDLQEIIRSVAVHYLKRGLDQTNGNKTKAAELLRFPSYQTLTNWLKKYGLE